MRKWESKEGRLTSERTTGIEGGFVQMAEFAPSSWEGEDGIVRLSKGPGGAASDDVYSWKLNVC